LIQLILPIATRSLILIKKKGFKERFPNSRATLTEREKIENLTANKSVDKSGKNINNSNSNNININITTLKNEENNDNDITKVKNQIININLNKS